MHFLNEILPVRGSNSGLYHIFEKITFVQLRTRHFHLKPCQVPLCYFFISKNPEDMSMGGARALTRHWGCQLFKI